MQESQRPARVSRAASLSALCGMLGLLAAGVGAAGAHAGWLRPLAGFLTCVAGLVLGGTLALLLGLAGLVLTRPSAGRAGRRRAWTGTAIGAALLGTVAMLAVPARHLPRIHDITTSPDDPPAFRQALQHPDNLGRRLQYPDGPADAAAQQRQAYPDLQPLQLALSPAEAHARVRAAVLKLGWQIAWEDAAAGEMEAEATSSLFRFVDDLALRVRPAAQGSVVDVRSTSRVGRGDLGANAARIRRLAEALR